MGIGSLKFGGRGNFGLLNHLSRNCSAIRISQVSELERQFYLKIGEIIQPSCQAVEKEEKAKPKQSPDHPGLGFNSLLDVFIVFLEKEITPSVLVLVPPSTSQL